MIQLPLFDDPVYFYCYLDLTLALDDPNIVKALTLNILTFGYDMDKGSKLLAIIYRISYKLLIQCSTPDAKIQIPKIIHWEDITLPNEWLLERETQPAKFASNEINLDYIQQYLDGTIIISFGNNNCRDEGPR